MTERLYYTSDALTGHAQVINVTPDEEGRYMIELDKTLFHPQGGGQPADRGQIAGITVEGVVQRDDRIVHLLAEPLATGEVEMRVDATTRLQHARLHSAGHLIGLAGEQCGWRPVKAHHWPGEGKITFAASGHAAQPEVSMLLTLIHQWLADDLPRHISFEDGLRMVSFGDLPAYPCGGTHVANLAAVGEVEITQIKVKKGQLLVSYTLA